MGEEFAQSIESRLASAHPERAKASITSHANQVTALVAEIKERDVIVTVDSSQIVVGVVSGPAHIAHKPIVIQGSNGDWEMEHVLRRGVTWGPSLARRVLPSALELTLFAHQTVFNIDEHWASIYHLLYPCFRFGDRLYLSANIEQPAEIDNYAVSQFFALLSGIEAVGAVLADGRQDLSYDEMFALYRAQHSFSLTTRAEFMSPGTAWSTAAMGTKRMAWTALLYVMLFGGDMTIVKTDGIFTREMREKALSLVLEMKSKHDLPAVIDHLHLEVPHVDTRPLDAHDNRTA